MTTLFDSTKDLANRFALCNNVVKVNNLRGLVKAVDTVMVG